MTLWEQRSPVRCSCGGSRTRWKGLLAPQPPASFSLLAAPCALAASPEAVCAPARLLGRLHPSGSGSPFAHHPLHTQRRSPKKS